MTRSVENFRINELLSTEQWKQIDARVHFAARNFLVARRLLTMSPPMGFGVASVEFNIFSEVSDADLIFSWPETHGLDAAVKAPTTLPVPIYRKDLYVGRRKLASSLRTGTPIDLASINSAVYKVTDKEDDLILNGLDFDGDGTYEISGLYTGAGNDEATSLDWGTATNIPTSIVNGIALLAADKIPPPYNVTVNPAQWAQAATIRTNTDRGYQDIIRNIAGGILLMSSNITAGTGLMSSNPLAGWFDAALTQDIITERALTLAQNLHVRLFGASVPRIYDSNALCKLSAI